MTVGGSLRTNDEGVYKLLVLMFPYCVEKKYNRDSIKERNLHLLYIVMSKSRVVVFFPRGFSPEKLEKGIFFFPLIKCVRCDVSRHLHALIVAQTQ